MTDTRRCVNCGCPAGDHIAFRYWFRCRRRHLFLRVVSRWLNKVQDTHPDW